jgi:hypothetical protein
VDKIQALNGLKLEFGLVHIKDAMLYKRVSI